ncbi:MAG: Double zinc ribbon [Planctomycetaceae bacterium]|nr:Double zinc ribbon [Planctomycetaceae bacterium]
MRGGFGIGPMELIILLVLFAVIMMVVIIPVVRYIFGTRAGDGGNQPHPQLKKCPGCGADIAAGSDFCPSCGLRVSV